MEDKCNSIAPYGAVNTSSALCWNCTNANGCTWCNEVKPYCFYGNNEDGACSYTMAGKGVCDGFEDDYIGDEAVIIITSSVVGACVLFAVAVWYDIYWSNKRERYPSSSNDGCCCCCCREVSSQQSFLEALPQSQTWVQSTAREQQRLDYLRGRTAAQLMQLRAEGHSAADLKAAGRSAAKVAAAGFSCDELKVAEFALSELVAAGFDALALRRAGFSSAQLEAAGGTGAPRAAASTERESLQVEQVDMHMLD
jgi:hypothetical protein